MSSQLVEMISKPAASPSVKMSTKVLFITLILISVCLCFGGTVGRFPTRHLPCCTRLSTANISNQVIGNTYETQSERKTCVEAVIFATPSGRVCVNPDAEWVKKLTAKMTKV